MYQLEELKITLFTYFYSFQGFLGIVLHFWIKIIEIRMYIELES